MDSDSKQIEQHPVQCRNGCGFYGNPGTEGMCSVCYKDAIQKKQLPHSNMPGSMSTLSQTIDTSEDSPSGLSTASPTIIVNEKQKVIEPEASTSEVATASAIVDGSIEPSATVETEEDKHKDGKKKKNRCLTCNKKVGLTGFDCRCGGLFCSLHRYSDKHDCTFNYKQMGADEIRKSNPVVKASKVNKI